MSCVEIIQASSSGFPAQKGFINADNYAIPNTFVISIEEILINSMLTNSPDFVVQI